MRRISARQLGEVCAGMCIFFVLCLLLELAV